MGKLSGLRLSDGFAGPSQGFAFLHLPYALHMSLRFHLAEAWWQVWSRRRVGGCQNDSGSGTRARLRGQQAMSSQRWSVRPLQQC